MNNKLEPSPELDKLIAEKVMGWHIKDWRDETDGGSNWHDSKGNRRAPYSWDKDPRWRWSPSTDIKAAWEVVVKMAEEHGPISVCWGDYGIDGPKASVMTLDDFHAIANTVPLAICQVALKVIDERVH